MAPQKRIYRDPHDVHITYFENYRCGPPYHFEHFITVTYPEWEGMAREFMSWKIYIDNFIFWNSDGRGNVVIEFQDRKDMVEFGLKYS